MIRRTKRGHAETLLSLQLRWCRRQRCGDRSRRSSGRAAAIVFHVCRHEMASCQCAAKTELPRQNCSSNDPCQFSRVGSRFRMSPSNAEKIKHGALWFQDRPSANRAHLDGRHRHTDLQITIEANHGQHTPAEGIWVAYFLMTVIQLLLSTFCAGSCPVARKIAVTTLAA